jgi:hypothetical protein
MMRRRYVLTRDGKFWDGDKFVNRPTIARVFKEPGPCLALRDELNAKGVGVEMVLAEWKECQIMNPDAVLPREHYRAVATLLFNLFLRENGLAPSGDRPEGATRVYVLMYGCEYWGGEGFVRRPEDAVHYPNRKARKEAQTALKARGVRTRVAEAYLPPGTAGQGEKK